MSFLFFWLDLNHLKLWLDLININKLRFCTALFWQSSNIFLQSLQIHVPVPSCRTSPWSIFIVSTLDSDSSLLDHLFSIRLLVSRVLIKNGTSLSFLLFLFSLFPSTLNNGLNIFVNYMKATGADQILYKRQLVHHHMFLKVCYDFYVLWT